MYKSLRLKSLMKQKGVSIEKLALDLNLSEEEAKQCCNNLFEADIDVLILLADYLDISAFSKAEFFQKAVEFLKKICYNSKDRLLNNWRNYYEIACNRWK